ncbi:general odorant-binding protein 56h-like [Rhagoletis pomonella]|uniref:general odorant-binding protein 56h-like n=1 Tax=Rhagoletis pomonella TaxID=28610 RepID=UPI00177C7B6C|nr:general odorant-binding protein 56h-like [Rhagoletis pomonella]
MRALYVLIGLTMLVASVTFVMCQSSDETDKWNRIACLSESNTTEDEVKKFFENGMKASEATNSIKCHVKCLLEKQGILNKSVYNADVAIKQLMKIPAMKGHETEVKQAVNSCKNEKGANYCDTAFKICMCIKEFKAQM